MPYPNSLGKDLLIKDSGIVSEIGQMQKTVLLGTARMLRNVLEI